VEQLKTLFNIATASPTQLALAEFLTNGGYDHHLRRIRRVYGRQMDLVRDTGDQPLPGRDTREPARRGFHLWVELPEELDSFRLYEEGIKEGISIAPGLLFTMGDRYRNCFR
jgi:DNA-binding transcriptional MocR family regulator